jgi:hypothetical protein
VKEKSTESRTESNANRRLHRPLSFTHLLTLPQLEMTLTQSGSQATGDLHVTGPFDPSGPIQVTISGNTARINHHPRLTGTLAVMGDIMRAHVIGGPFDAFATLQRQK